MKSSFPNGLFFAYRRCLYKYRRYLCIFILKIKKHRRYLKKRCLSRKESIGTSGSFPAGAMDFIFLPTWILLQILIQRNGVLRDWIIILAVVVVPNAIGIVVIPGEVS